MGAELGEQVGEPGHGVLRVLVAGGAPRLAIAIAVALGLCKDYDYDLD